MKPDPDPALEIGTPVETACGGRVLYTPLTPRAFYRGEMIFFCTPSCKTDYEISPETSCLAGRIMLDRR